MCIATSSSPDRATRCELDAADGVIAGGLPADTVRRRGCGGTGRPTQHAGRCAVDGTAGGRADHGLESAVPIDAAGLEPALAAQASGAGPVSRAWCGRGGCRGGRSPLVGGSSVGADAHGEGGHAGAAISAECDRRSAPGAAGKAAGAVRTGGHGIAGCDGDGPQRASGGWLGFWAGTSFFDADARRFCK